MGYSKKLYNVLGGVTSIIIALGHPKVCIKFYLIEKNFCADSFEF